MIFKKLCEECAKDANNYVPGEVYIILDDQEVCPRCREKWVVRLAMASWYMMVLGSSISLIFAIVWSYDFGRVVGLSPDVCNFIWIIILVTCFWFVTTSLGKWVAKKFGLLSGVKSTKEWDWNDSGMPPEGEDEKKV